MKNSALLIDLCFTEIFTTSCFHCLHAILEPRYWQFHVFIVFRMTMSLNLLYFVRFFISYHNRNWHHQSSLYTKFQYDILFCYQDIGNIMLSLSSNDDVIKFDLFCQLIPISLPQSKSV